jgi:hypothetical protein
LIARQRVNLNRTFAHADETTVDDEVARRLTRFEQELAAATAEFTEGLEQIAGPVPALHEATDAMRAAVGSLGSKDLKAARPQEEQALAGLIKARQNLRKFLSLKSGGLANSCRNFDRQQDQKLRRPPVDKTNEQLAQLEKDVAQLAEQQRKFSEEIEAKGGGGARLDRPGESRPEQPKSPPPSSGSQPSPSDRQQAAAREAERLRRLARLDPALSDLARSRMDEAARDVKASDSSLREGRPDEAAAQAREAAKRLERLAGQVAALKASELAARLAKARDLARGLARREAALGQAIRPDDGPDDDRRRADEQQGLAEDAKTLADLLTRLKTDAAEEDRELSRAIARASEANSPSTIEEALRQAAAALASGARAQAARDAETASGRLDALARDLDAARRAFVQPRLDRLIAAEAQAAEAQKALHSVRNESQKAEAEKTLTDLARALAKLGDSDGPLRPAAEALQRASQLGAGGWSGPERLDSARAGFYSPPVNQADAVRAVVAALQAQIQEIILNDALVDRDGAVPPQYKGLVEDYYRILSQDLR